MSDRTSRQVLKELCFASGNQCAFPGCSALLFDLATNVLIGEKAHIRSREPNGPRHEPGYPDEDIDSFDNQLWLCPTHHTLVDKAPEQYPIEQLVAMKREHEQSPPQADPGELGRLFAAVLDARDDRQISVVSYNQRGGQTAAFITNIGQQPRTFEGSDLSGILAVLWRMGPRKTLIRASSTAPDVSILVQEIHDLLVRRAGWPDVSTGFEMVFAAGGGGTPRGLVFLVPDEGSQDILDLANAFGAMGWRIAAHKHAKLEAGLELEIKVGTP